MAKKRLKKKQQNQKPKKQPKQQTHRQKQEQLRTEKLQRQQPGLTAEQARKLQQYNREQQVLEAKRLQDEAKKEADRQKRRDRDRRREQANIEILRNAGFTEEEAYKLRRSTKKQLEEYVQAMQTGNDDYLLVFVRDKTGGRMDAITGEGTGEWSEAVYWQKQMAKGLGISSLLKGINSALEGMDAVGNIGEAVIDVVPESHIEQTLNFRAKQDYFLVYRGQGRSYKALVSLINNVMSFLYLRTQRDVFIQDLRDNLYHLGNSAARKNAARINEEFLMDEEERAAKKKQKRRRRKK